MEVAKGERNSELCRDEGMGEQEGVKLKLTQVLFSFQEYMQLMNVTRCLTPISKLSPTFPSNNRIPSTFYTKHYLHTYHTIDVN